MLKDLRLATFNILGAILGVIMTAVVVVTSVVLLVYGLSFGWFMNVKRYTPLWEIFLPNVHITWNSFLRLTDIFAGHFLLFTLCLIAVVFLRTIFFRETIDSEREENISIAMAVVIMILIYAELSEWVTGNRTAYLLTFTMESPVRLSLIGYQYVRLLASWGVTNTFAKLLGAIALLGSLYEGIVALRKVSNLLRIRLSNMNSHKIKSG
jgi:hypothetical protein